MSDLQLSLLGLGCLLVAGVWGYNKLQERKYRQAAEKVFAGEQADVLAPEMSEYSATEPSEDYDTPEAFAEPVMDERREPTFEAERFTDEAPLDELPNYVPVAEVEEVVELAAPQVQAVSIGAPPADWCDESIDLIARLHFQERIGAEDLRQAQSAMQGHQRVSLRVFVEVASGQWQSLAEAGSGNFAQVWFALQLVDRRGAVSTNDFEGLRHSLQALASLRDGSLSFPDVSALAEQARALDEFCAQLDLQLALNVLNTGEGVFPGTKIRGMAEAAGMRLMTSGEFQAQDEDGNFLFALANMGEPFDPETLRNVQTHGLTFLLDVPHVRNGGHAFERMLSTGRQFATSLDATLVNAQRAPVTDVMVEGIRRKIIEIHEQMTLAGIPAGGARALRLFS